MGRKSLTVSERAFERCQSLKEDDESWSEFLERTADALGDEDTEHGPSTVAVTNVNELARATADEVENRLTRH